MITEKNPFRVFSKWYETAKGTGLKDPEKMTLATVGPDGRPSSRIVLFKDVNDNGFTFFTNFKSRKAREMDLNPYVSAVIFWEDPGFQVRIEGRVEMISSLESDRYFNTRPRGSQLSAWASLQSSEIPSRASLEQEMKRYAEMYEGKSVPRPPYWGGYRLAPDRFEFWKEGKDRLHERLVYIKESSFWKHRILAP